MGKKNAITKTKIKKVLSQAAFEPTGPMGVIISMDNPDYCEMRAIELLTESRKVGLLTHETNMKTAIRLIVTSMLLREADYGVARNGADKIQ